MLEGWTPELLTLAAGAFAMSFALGINSSGINNYLAGGGPGQFRVAPEQLGILEGIRETSGLLTVFFATLAAGLMAPRLAAAALIVMGIGMTALGPAPNLVVVALAGFCWGVGFHLFGPVSNSIILALAARGREGHALGRMASVQALGQPIGMAAVVLLAGVMTIRGMFVIAGVVALLGGLVLLRLPADLGGIKRMRLFLRRRYARYYLLQLLDGGRKQIFITFAVFLMVRLYHFDVRAVAAIMVVNNLLMAFVSPRVGRWIDRHGVRPILLLNYTSLIFVFLGYAFILSPAVMVVLYALDNLLFTSNIAFTVYLRHLAPADEVRPSLSMGVTFNHVFSAGIPPVGGLIWAVFGYQAVFVGGAALVVILLFVSLGVEATARRAAVAA